AALAIWLALSVGLKVLRYSHAAPEIDTGNTEVTRFVETQGWTLSEKQRAENAHHRYVFTKVGCPGRLTLIVLGIGPESTLLIDRERGGNVGYFQNGELKREPRVWRISLGRLANAFKGLFQPALNNSHAMFAVSPPPPTSSEPCQGPPAAAWKEYLAGL